MMRNKRRDRLSRDQTGEIAVFIFKLTDRETPVEGDPFNGFIPWVQPVGEIFRVGPHAEFPHDRTPARLFRAHIERQRACVAFAVIDLISPACTGQSGRVRDLPIVKFAVGHDFHAAGADAAQRDAAFAGLGHYDLCHG